jgi:hypothetical protein
VPSLSSRRVQLVVAAVLVAVLLVAGVVVFALTGAQGGGSLYREPPPSARALAAMAALQAPSLPGPLPGSTPVGGTSYLAAGACADARAAYKAVGAPIPAGSTLADGPNGILLINAPFRQSAVSFEDGQAGCYYHILGAPTIHLLGAGPVPSGDSFAAVGCYGTGVDTTAMAEFQIGAQTYTIYLGSPKGVDVSGSVSSKQFVLFIGQGTIKQVVPTLTKAPHYPVAVSGDPDHLAADLQGDAMGGRLELACTTSLIGLFEAAAHQ